MRIALCISGQMRGYKKAIESVRKRLIEPFNTDVFIHTWSDIGSSSNEHYRAMPYPFFHYIPPTDTLEDRINFDKTFPALSERVLISEVVTSKDLKETYNPVDMVIEPSPKLENYEQFFNITIPKDLLKNAYGASFSLPLFYKMWKCNELKQAAEVAGNFKYDLVIHLRPDLFIGSELKEAHLDQLDRIYFRIRSIDPSYQMADQFFFGPSEMMDKVCDTFNHIPALWDEFTQGGKSYKFYWAEGLFYSAIRRMIGVTTEPYRTESSGQKTLYPMLSYSHDRYTYLETKDCLFADILAMSKSLAPTVDTLSLDEKAPVGRINESDIGNFKIGLSRALATYIGRQLKGRPTVNTIKKLEELIIEFEDTLRISAPLARSHIAIVKEDWSTAKSSAIKALESESGSTEILRKLAKISLQLDQPEDAVTYAKNAIDLPDEYDREKRQSKWDLFDMLAKAYEKLGNFSEAQSAYLGAFSLNPHRAPAAYRTGKMLYRLGDFDQSLWFLRYAQTLDPTHHSAAYFEVRSLIQVRMYMDADAIIDRFLPDASNTKGRGIKFLGPRAVVAWHRGKREVATAAIDSYLASGVLHEDVIVDLYGLLIQLNREEEAMSLAEKGLKNFPQSDDILKQLQNLDYSPSS
jgi:tetratricopeptide (TPR) repeat protein